MNWATVAWPSTQRWPNWLPRYIVLGIIVRFAITKPDLHRYNRTFLGLLSSGRTEKTKACIFYSLRTMTLLLLCNRDTVVGFSIFSFWWRKPLPPYLLLLPVHDEELRSSLSIDITTVILVASQDNLDDFGCLLVTSKVNDVSLLVPKRCFTCAVRWCTKYCTEASLCDPQYVRIEWRMNGCRRTFITNFV